MEKYTEPEVEVYKLGGLDILTTSLTELQEIDDLEEEEENG